MRDIKATYWTKLNKAGLSINCNKKGCSKKALMRTKTNSTGEIGFKDLQEYEYYCANHIYL